MNDSENTTPGPLVTIGAMVPCVHLAHTWNGTVVKKHRSSAHVVGDHHRGFRVPYALLTVSPGTIRQPVPRHTDDHRASFHPGERVQFALQGALVDVASLI
jgi:hypothetical protein